MADNVPLDRDVVFQALTRPQMFAGVTYSWFVLNLVLTAEIFLILKTPLALLSAALIHAAGYVASIKEPRFLELWITRASRCPRTRNFALWGRNSYTP